MRRSLRRWSLTLLWSLAVALLSLPAAAAETGELRIDGVDTSDHPEVRLELALPGEVRGDDLAAAFTLTEDGEPRSVSVSQLHSDDVEIVLLVDTSGSMRGEPIDAARRAAGAFLDRLPAGVELAVVGFGSEAAVLAPFTADRASKQAAIAGLVAAGETALYDGVATALAQFADADRTASRSIVLLSDGGDTASRATLDATAGALTSSGVRLHAIELRTSETDPASLARLAEASDGQVVPVDDAAGLDTVYTSLASDLVNRLQLSYRSATHGSALVRVALQWQGSTVVGEQQITLPDAPVTPTPAKPAPAPQPQGEGHVIAAPAWASPAVLIGGALAVFLGSLTLAYVVLVVREPRRRLAVESGALRASRPTAFAGLAGRATTLAERQLEAHGWRGGLNVALERAGLDLRPGEYVVLAACGATTAFGLGLVLANLLMGVLFGLVALLAARVLLSVLASRRQAAFAEQLGDVLQLLAGSLRAGYGMLQAIDAVAREADAPAADEFGRLVIEARLGRDVPQSLRALADRVDSEDFAWVVQAIEIHREVGGDLAEVLDTVAGTIRERNQIRRQIKALSAEGRYSAYVLLALPFGVAFMISMTNPGYLSELTQSVPGIIMAVMAVILMGVGALWLRKLTRLVF